MRFLNQDLSKTQIIFYYQHHFVTRLDIASGRRRFR